MRKYNYRLLFNIATEKIMLTLKKIILITLSTYSLNAGASYICQPSSANGYEGYDDNTLYNDYYLFNNQYFNYTDYKIVQETSGLLQAKYWCLYQSDRLYRDHMNTCNVESDIYPVCPISIGGLVNNHTNYNPYVNPITDGDCVDESVCIDIPQTLTLSTADSDNSSGSGYIHGEFLVESNGWVDFNFSGSYYDDQGEVVNVPYFHKQYIDAKGEVINNKYDHINTLIGVRVSNAELLKQRENEYSYDSWNLGAYYQGSQDIQPMGSPEKFILPITNDESPGHVIGAFSPALTDGGKASIHVYAIMNDFVNIAPQSGKYQMNITLKVTAREP
jgi:hypothetical protein